MRGREFHINLDFDVSLRPGGGGDRRDAAARQGRDLAPVFLLAGGQADRLLLEDRVPTEFLEYLKDRGLEHTAIGDVRRPARERRFVPYGWNESAAALARCYERPPDHPDLAVIRMVNSRKFSADLERDLFGGDHVRGVFASIPALRAALRSADSPYGFVVKANHSNASLGNRRLRAATPDPHDLRVIARLLEESGPLVLETWRSRDQDLVVTMDVEQDGTARSIHVHEIVNTADGAFLGALFVPPGTPSPLSERHSTELSNAGRAIAARLAEVGYFGPACFDAFTWRDGGRVRLRPLVDLNARLGMSKPFREVARRLGDELVCYGRFFSARRFPFGGDQRVFESRLADRGFDPSTQSGVLLASPLRLGEGTEARVARRFAVVFVGRSRQDVLALDAWFREEFDR